MDVPYVYSKEYTTQSSKKNCTVCNYTPYYLYMDVPIGKRVQSRGSHLNPNTRTNKQVILRMLFLVATQGPLKVENGGHVTLKFRSTFKFC